DDDKNLSDKKGIHIEGLQKTYNYTGDKIIPDFDVVDYGTDGVRRLLSQGVDYTVTYKNNKEVSTSDKKAEIIIKGKGNYTTNKDKLVTANFEIVAVTGAKTLADLKGAKLTEKIQPLEYNGEFQYPNFKLTLGDKTTQVEYKYIDGEYKKNGTDDLDVNIAVSNNKNKGNATILVTGADGTNGKPTTVKIKFKITPVSLAEATVTVQNKDNIFYSPNGASPEVKVTATVGSGQTAKTLELEKGRDYIVKYAKNKAAGDATVTVTGKGNYTKKANPAPYTIKPAKMSDFEVKAVTAYEGIKVGKIAATVADDHGNVLKPNQYTLEYYTVNKAADGTSTKGTKHEDLKLELEANAEICVVAVAKDDKNLETADTNKATADAFFAAKKNIAKAKITLADDIKKGKPYTGNEVELTNSDLVVTYDGTPLVMNTKETKGSYEVVSYTNNINKGTATAVIQGVNDYSGTKTIKFKIGQKTINDNVSFSDRIKAAFSGLFN
ncbi:MAG: hypothetical protein HDR25_07360, partial [Lachnospiraceae bacterium]|nr:hypothetical protein [Lachnospiraceae bacterium]